MRYLGFIHFPDVVVTIDLTVDGPMEQFVAYVSTTQVNKTGRQKSIFSL